MAALKDLNIVMSYRVQGQCLWWFLFKKWEQRVCSNYRGITLLGFLVKPHAKVPERRLRTFVEAQICVIRFSKVESILVMQHGTSCLLL